MQEDYLIHYGVKGMKWGVTRKRVSAKESRATYKKVKPKLQDNVKKSKAKLTKAKTSGSKEQIKAAKKDLAVKRLTSGLVTAAETSRRGVRVGKTALQLKALNEGVEIMLGRSMTSIAKDAANSAARSYMKSQYLKKMARDSIKIGMAIKDVTR